MHESGLTGGEVVVVLLNKRVRGLRAMYML